MQTFILVNIANIF